MIRALDARLIAGHQHVVDLAQRQPRWLSEQCVIGLAVLTVLRAGLVDGLEWWIVVRAIALGMLWSITRAPVIFAMLGSALITRMWFLAIFVVRLTCAVLLLAYGAEVGLDVWISLASDIAITSFAYFAACRPPRPRVPRTRMAHAGGAA